MSEGDLLVGMVTCHEEDKLLTVTATGYGRISPISDYRRQARGGKGIINYRTARFGEVCAIVKAEQGTDAIMISSNGVIIRIALDEVSIFARPAKGVRVMKVAEGERVLTVSVAEHDEEEVEELEIDPTDTEGNEAESADEAAADAASVAEQPEADEPEDTAEDKPEE